MTADYVVLTGESLCKTVEETKRYLEKIPDIVERSGTYYTKSAQSAHITKLVEEQHVKNNRKSLPRYQPPQRRHLDHPPESSNDSAAFSSWRPLAPYAHIHFEGE